MTTKVVQTTTNKDVLYKVIKDGYKTVTHTINVTNDMPTRTSYNLEPSSVVHNPQLSYTIDTTHTYPPVLQFNSDVITPDNVIIENNKYLIAPYGESYLIIDGSEDIDNFTRVGDINVNIDGTVNNFSNSNYLKTLDNFNPGNDSWEICYKFRTGNSLSAQWCQGTANAFDCITPLLGVTDNHFSVYLSSNGSGWDIAQNVQGSYTVLQNTVYWIKLIYSGTDYKLYYSLDNETWIEEIIISNSTPIVSQGSCIRSVGMNHWSNNSWQPFSGTIYLDESYIKINGDLWWKPTWKKLYSQYQSIGSINVTNGIVNNFSSSNYLRMFGFQPGSQPWEIELKFYLTSTSGTNVLVGCVENRYYCPYLRVIDGKMSLYLSSNGSSWNITSNSTSSSTVSANTWHTVRLLWTGSYYRVIVDGVTYITITSSTPIIRNAYPLCIGKYLSSSIALSYGTIDLNNSYIKVNDKIVWEPFDVFKINATKIGTPNIYANAISNGFSTSNYFVLPESFNPGNNTWEWVMKINTGSRTGQFIGGYDYGGEGIEVGISDNKMIWWLGTTFDSYDIASGQMGNNIYSANTDYWIKMVFDGTKYELFYSTNKKDWISDIVTISSSKIFPYLKVLGCDRAQNGAVWGGSIDFSESYIKINNIEWWNGVYCAGEYINGILDSNYTDTGDQVTLNLYDVQTNERILILNTDRNVNVSNKKYVQYDGQITIPDHGLSLYNSNDRTWSKYRYITLDVDNSDTVIYTEGDIQ